MWKAGVVLALTVAGFVLHGMLHLEPATIALAGAAILLLISRLEPHHVLAEVEWATIFFFIGLFIIIGGIVKVGMVTDLSALVIQATNPTSGSMFKTSMAILWFSGFLSAFVDNIPYVATMAPLVNEMAGQVLQNGASGHRGDRRDPAQPGADAGVVGAGARRLPGRQRHGDRRFGQRGGDRPRGARRQTS